jgi:NAD(P) transhydrogenase subunit alpha
LLTDGHEILVQADAGAAAYLTDAQYARAGARIAETAESLYAQVDGILKVQPPALDSRTGRHEADLLREGTIVLGFLDPLRRPDVVTAFAKRRITSYALELIPRITRAQSMDALTSMATVAGYKAVLIAADRLGRFFPLLMTAAGTIAPANVLVLGAGVAGLQAIATARRLGALVTAFDPRPAVREQVQSLGASFLEMAGAEAAELASGYASEQSDAFLRAERACIADRLAVMDVVICAAQVFGKHAPILISAEMVTRLHPGAVIVDLAADQGGNCELTEPGGETERDGVRIIGAGNLPALVPTDASQMFAHNVVSLFRHLYPAQGNPPDQTDEIVRATCVTRDGAVVSEAVRAALADTTRIAPPVMQATEAKG